MNCDYDILVNGGGMVGLTAAVALAELGLQVLVIEPNELPSQWHQSLASDRPPSLDDYAARVSAISPANHNYLQVLGIWQQLSAQRLGAFEKMHVWDASGTGQITFDAADIGEASLGTIVENEVLRLAALKVIQAKTNIDLRSKVSVTEFTSCGSYQQALLSDQSMITVKLVVGADGAFSQVRKAFAIGLQEMPYQQMAMVTHVETERAHQATAWQRFNTEGPVAFLPLASPHHCSIVWSMDIDKAEAVKQLSAAELKRALEQAFESRLGAITRLTKVAHFPLIKRRAERYLAPGCVLVGDAAHTIHPLAGQGVNLGFQDIDCLVACIKRQKEANRDWALMANLRAFERERAAKNWQMQEAMSGFKWLFGQSNLAITLARNLALHGVDQLGLVKQKIIKSAMGYSV